MPRMLELIRASALPAHQMMSAAKGALRLPAEETVEILVYLAEHSKIFGEPARLTLAGWDESSAKAIAADPKTSKEVLDYWLSPKNLRPVLFPLLLENEGVLLTQLAVLTTTLNGEWVDAMLASPRVRRSMQLLTDLSTNTRLTLAQTTRVQELITGRPATVDTGPRALPVVTSLHAESIATKAEPSATESAPAAKLEPAAHDAAIQAEDPETEDALVAFFTQHAAEISANADKPFQPIGGIHELVIPHEQAQAAAVGASADSPAQPAGAPNVVHSPGFPKKPVPEEHRGSILQKITKLDVKGRIQLAMKGNKEERSILVRDGTKIVALAVLDSPKISDGEVEKFASQKNVLESLLRAIPLKRRFAKNYVVIRNLVFNPRTPLDASLGLMKGLLVQDLKNLCGNKEVADTVRKLALRMYQQKTQSANKKD
jgi:hypothetical protein